MSEPFIAEIVMFGGGFAPRTWALCDGQLISIPTNSALFSLLGTTFGGDGRSTFGLPGMRGRAAMHAGNGPGLTPRRLGQRGGTETDIMTVNTMPTHNHGASGKINVSNANGTSKTAPGNFVATDSGAEDNFADSKTADKFLNAASASITVNSTGNQQSIDNMGPYNTVNYIIALYGIFPSRS